MPAGATVATQTAEYLVLSVELPRGGTHSAGILLLDPESDRLYVRLRRDWAEFVDPEELDIFELLEDDLREQESESGAAALLARFEDSLSLTLRISERKRALVEDFDRALNRLYRQHVEAKVHPYRTHVPIFTLRAAAGRFLDNAEIGQEGWVEVSEGNLDERYFAAWIAGHSMEPRIPDGALCLFRANVVGSRKDKLVLVEDRGGAGADRYAIKRYKSGSSASQSGEWRHNAIRLESLNPDYPSWYLDENEDRYAILGEFLRILE